MRRMVSVLVVSALLPVAVKAQEWQTYTYDDPGFSIQFPQAPTIDTSKIKGSGGVSLPMTRYQAREQGMVYSVNVVNYSTTNSDALGIIVEAQRALAATGKVTGVSGARLSGSHGRELLVEGKDGSRSDVLVFFIDKHLYTVSAQALPPNVTDRSDDALRFVDSLQFLDDSGGGFGRLFHNEGSRARSTAAARPSAPVSRASIATSPAPVSVPGAVPGPAASASPRPSVHGPSDAACAGKSAGDAVQVETPNGPVEATCTLVARPNSAATSGGPQGPAGR